MIKIYVFDQNGIKYKNMDTIRLLGSQEKIHGLVESGFSGERKRNLWRLEYLGDRLYLLILSPDRPDLSIGVRRYGFLMTRMPIRRKITHHFWNG